jgi:hypothetical protein
MSGAGGRTLRALGGGTALVVASALTSLLTVGTTAAGATASVKPNSVGMLDCNGHSLLQASVARTAVCADIRGFQGVQNANSEDGRFYDNGHYIGHDEPSVTYLSSTAGSGDNVTWTETLGKDPAALPTVQTPGKDVTHFFELTPAPWFAMDVCDSNSYPQLPCTPRSDRNAPSHDCIFGPCKNKYPGAGAAFVELQFYPPGWTPPWTVGISCDNTHWCAALTIDSLSCTFGFANCNANCIEPVNFAFIATNGQPAGHPSPQLAGLSTFLPNSHTLLMNPGDRVTAQLSDAPVPGGNGAQALKAVVSDLTTGKTGYMQASAANGFMHTSIVDCSGTPFNFEPEYRSAKRDNIAPWTALQGDVITQYEIGHFEACTSLTGNGTFTISGQSDPYRKHCHGPYETTAAPDGGKTNAEAGDAPCFKQGDTHPAFGGLAPDEVTGCVLFFTQNGDLDFDGSAYWPDWPDSTTPDKFPATFQQQQPAGAGGQSYPQYFFQTDAALSESTCTGTTGCAVPPPNAPGNFYPYWTLTASCAWEFGNMTNGNTFGGPSAEYGTNQIATLGYPEIMSAVYQNTC